MKCRMSTVRCFRVACLGLIAIALWLSLIARPFSMGCAKASNGTHSTNKLPEIIGEINSAFEKGNYSQALGLCKQAWDTKIDMKDPGAITLQMNVGRKLVMSYIFLSRYDEAKACCQDFEDRYKGIRLVVRGLPAESFAQAERQFLLADVAMAEGSFGTAKSLFGDLRKWFLAKEGVMTPEVRSKMTDPAFMRDLSRECEYGEVVAFFCKAWEGGDKGSMVTFLSRGASSPMNAPEVSDEARADAYTRLVQENLTASRNYRVQIFGSVESVVQPVYVDVALVFEREPKGNLNNGDYRFLLVHEGDEWKVAGIYKLEKVGLPLPPIKRKGQ